MNELVYCKPQHMQTTKVSDDTVKQVKICKCTGQEKVTFVDEDKIPSYSGEIKSPIKIIWLYPNTDDGLIIKDSEVRKWVKDACEYHKIPHVILALILQNENNPNAPGWRKFAQFFERTITTAANIVDELVFIIPNFISKGSSGIANVSDQALKDGVRHSLENYARPPVPSSVARTFFGISTDTRISGDDWRNDLYYAAAHIRYLIDKTFGDCYSGELSNEELRLIIKAYNGSGPAADKYAQNAMANLDLAIHKKGNLYFYER
ncbi:hypothetical protein HYE59_08210 [Aggregatibacter actinomycetemcomitans]|uniref:hypothetical protein n=1 Tax=Aggregatibacter actinomycetemcomitans TaxID=714 RepID=UPI00197B0AA4|nr:hypothetical protein [Aggregatibacter actinomycetemcomitans]MBN6076939.1 hypothetical protein [Aggregatibacter actinomycetemcomitans]MBN6077398.1 hypothetical protein [Aggregatibacter actinomycetemcomitans]MBN6077511.1 hypothetical protein [Aggregatibacter actinomycetemcomitans]